MRFVLGLKDVSLNTEVTCDCIFLEILPCDQLVCFFVSLFFQLKIAIEQLYKKTEK